MSIRDIITDTEEAEAAAILAALVAIRDGEIVDGIMSDGAKRYIRREMRRYAGREQNLKDYGYQHGSIGRRGPQKPPRTPADVRRHEYMAQGLCTTCGREPVPGLVCCMHCREKRKEYNQKYKRK